MTKRLTWLLTGFGLGVYLAQRLRRIGERLAPPDVRDRVKSTVAEAVAEGRAAGERRERTLRELFAAPDRDRTGR
jgi:hypothetical protein